MSKAFVYIMTTVTSEYDQEENCNVPTQWGDRLYFGPCKIPMRPRMRPGDYIVGVSPSRTTPRKVLYAAEVEEVITFGEAYRRYPKLHGPSGPIHVKPVNRAGSFPESDYEFIEDSVHDKEWRKDLAGRELDRFFICKPAVGWRNRWLGAHGPEVDAAILALLNRSPVFGMQGLLSLQNQGTLRNPIEHAGGHRGLHVEVGPAELLLGLCCLRLEGIQLPKMIDTPRLVGKVTGSCSCSREEVAEHRPSRC